ncbi:MAG TPA: SRPBCC family protein [Dongiaceae bacterium]|jgi:uncharacterized protein YndB with AHSA1/START domain|nr:SRPBCC family protein [Dongiaceae bacterium]
MSHDGSILDLHTVEFKRLLPGPIELAWDYLTKPELLKTWFADVTLEPRVGGTITVGFGKAGCGGASVEGTILEFRRPHMFTFSWIKLRPQPDGSIMHSHEGDVRFELAEKGDKVLLTLLHSGLPVHELAGHGAGWHAYMDNLESRIAGHSALDVMAIFHDLRPRYDERVVAAQRAGAA